LLHIDKILQGLLFGLDEYDIKENTTQIGELDLSEQVEFLLNESSPYKLISEYNEVKKFLLANSFMYPRDLFDMEDYIQELPYAVKGRKLQQQAIDEFLQQNRKDKNYKERLKLGKHANSRYEELSEVRVINIKLLLGIMEELMMKPHLEDLITSKKRPSNVQTAT